MRYFALLTLFALVCCTKEPTLPPSEQGVAPRTVIAYLCGDNNLSAEVDIKIMALRQGMEHLSDTAANLIVYADYRDRMPELIRITHTGRTTLKQFAELNSASPENLREVLESVIADYPAHSYGLLCFSHGSGWLPPGALNNPEGFAQANAGRMVTSRTLFEDNGNEMSVSDFAAALPLPGGRKFDFIVMEACFMAGVEVAYELKEKTECMVASAAEILSDGFVEVYPGALTLLMQDEPDPEAFARRYFETWNAKSGAYRSATISVINTQHLEDLAAVVRQVNANGTDADTDAAQYFDRHSYHLFLDLADVVGQMASPEQKANFDAALEKVVEYAAATPFFMYGQDHSFAIGSHCGLTTYVEQSAFQELNERYHNTMWYRATSEGPATE